MDITQTIGRTPLIELRKFSPPGGACILAKLEFFNPGRSVKDRIALHMIEVAEREEKLLPGGTILEATSGNTGIGLALVAAARGYRLILVMPDTMSRERMTLLQAYGAQVYLIPGEQGMSAAVELADRLHDEHPTWFMPRQFANPANPAAHRLTTGPELLEQLPGSVDVFVAGVGTGGTITGVGEVLRQRYPRVKIVAVEPAGSPVLSGGQPGPHKIQGIGAGFIPLILNRDLIDQVLMVADREAFLTSRRVAALEGLTVGISAGATLHAAHELATRMAPGKRVLTVLPDTGERYFSLDPYFRLDLRTT